MAHRGSQAHLASLNTKGVSQMKDYRKFFVSLGATGLMGIHSAITDGSLVLPIPKHWELVCLALISAVLVWMVPNGDKPAKSSE